MKKVPLKDFLSFLNGQSEKDFKGDAVEKYLKKYLVTQDELAPFIFFREETYGRNLVAKNDFYELMILTWLPHQRTPIHDHAGQRCWMTIQSGSLSVKNYLPPKSGKAELVAAGGCETHSAGETVYIDDGIGVHAICNTSTKPAVSVHLYAGPIPECRIYNESARRFEVQKLQYFTMYGEEWDKASLEPR